MSKSAKKRMEFVESVAVGAGFLLQKLQGQYGSDFGVGMEQQVRQCILDCKQIERAVIIRRDREIYGDPK